MPIFWTTRRLFERKWFTVYMHYFHHSLIKLLKKPVVSNGSNCFHRNMAVHFNFYHHVHDMIWEWGYYIWGYYILQTHTHFIFNICGIFSLNGVIHECALTRICIVSYINTTHQNWSLKHNSVCFYNIVDIYCGEKVEAIFEGSFFVALNFVWHNRLILNNARYLPMGLAVPGTSLIASQYGPIWKACHIPVCTESWTIVIRNESRKCMMASSSQGNPPFIAGFPH